MRKSYETVASSVHRIYNRHWDKLENPEAVNSLLAEVGGGHFSELTPRIFGVFRESFTDETLAANPKLTKYYRFAMESADFFNDASVHAATRMLYGKPVRPLFNGGITGTEGHAALFKPSQRAFDRCIRRATEANFEKLDRALGKLSEEILELQHSGSYSAETAYVLEQYEIYLVNSMLREPMNGG